MELTRSDQGGADVQGNIHRARHDQGGRVVVVDWWFSVDDTYIIIIHPWYFQLGHPERVGTSLEDPSIGLGQ